MYNCHNLTVHGVELMPLESL